MFLVKSGDAYEQNRTLIDSKQMEVRPQAGRDRAFVFMAGKFTYRLYSK